MAELTSMGVLATVSCADDNKECLAAIINSLDENFPHGWRDWKVYNYTFEDLFGSAEIPSAVEAKVRFAIPTIDLARAFNPSRPSLSERTYRAIRANMLKWPLGRALLYAPHNLMEKIHAPSYKVFMNTVRDLKPKLVKRQEVSQQLERLSSLSGGSLSASTKRSIEGSAKVCHNPAKRARIQSESQVNPLQSSNEHVLASIFSQQTLFFNKLLSMQSEQNENIITFIQNQQSNDESSTHQSCKKDLKSSYDALPDRTHSEQNNKQVLASKGLPHLPGIWETKEDDLRKKIADTQRELVVLTDGKNSNIAGFNFTPTTMEHEPKIAQADPVSVKYGLSCQRLNESSWCDVKYADVQKDFQATPVFTSLKANNLLAELTPNWKTVDVLEKFDLTLAAISNGLIQQKMIYNKLLDALPLDVKNIVGRDFIAANSRFRKTSDALLQYVCGRRAEVIRQRRDIYKPNKAFRGILYDIPPSGTHLFEDKSLTEMVKELGGLNKLFPDRNRQYANKKTVLQMPKHKMFQPTNHRFRDSGNNVKRNPSYRREGDRKGRNKSFPSKTL